MEEQMKPICVFIVVAVILGCSTRPAHRISFPTETTPIRSESKGDIDNTNRKVSGHESLKYSIQRSKIDLPEPASALSRSMFFPGAGYFYLSDKDGAKPNDLLKASLYFICVTGGAVAAINASNKRAQKASAVAIGISIAVGVHLLEIVNSTDEAAKRRDAILDAQTRGSDDQPNPL
jgi:hypothetical protein